MARVARPRLLGRRRAAPVRVECPNKTASADVGAIKALLGQRHPGPQRCRAFVFGRNTRVAVPRCNPARSLSHPLRDNPMPCVRFAAALVGLSVLAGPAAAADAPAVTVEVDARELPRKLLHTTL